jgi:nucleotide-binding universal stress UspA family protein
MIPEIKSILYATDLSENARYAFGYAVSLANRYDAKVTLLHIIPDVSPTADSLVINTLGEEKWMELRRSREKEVLSTIRSRLEKFCDDIKSEVPACPFITDKIIVKIGNPVEEILHQVKVINCDLVVMGAHGHGLLSDAMMGSTSRRVVRRCKKPVLIVRLP